MFNIDALMKMINTNNDQYIEKKEVEEFVKKTKSPSIFNDYFNSINEKVDYWEFQNKIGQIVEDEWKKTEKVPDIEFTDDKYNKEYEKCTLDVINGQRDFLFRQYGYKTSDKSTFNILFDKLLQESVEEGNMYNVGQKLKEIKLDKPITMDYMKDFLQNNYNLQLPNGVTLSKDIDWSNSREVFRYLSFDEMTFANTSKEHLPEGYDPQQVFEKGKSLGLGIDEVHKMGYTGKGVSVAICDWQLKPHQDLNVKENNCAEYASQISDYFHASAVTGILAGKKTGVAPDSDVYFYGEYENNSETDGGNDMINTLKSIIEKNNTLPKDKKIRVVSISGEAYGNQEEVQKLVKELTDSGVWVFDSNEFWKNFGYLEKKDPMGDTNDFNNYQINHPNNIDHPEQGLYVSSGDRTVPDPTSEMSYRHDSRASASWAIPVVAGYYALACQADPNMTPEIFIKLAKETARVQKSTTFKDISKPYEGRTEETVDIKIIDVKALLKEIERTKGQS